MRLAKILTGVALAVLVLAAVLVMTGIPAGPLVGMMQDRVEKDTGYRLDIAGSSRINLWPQPIVELRNVTLVDPKDRDASQRLTIESIQADVSLRSLFSGQPRLRELTINRPVLTLPLVRERIRQADPAPRSPTSAAANDTALLPVDRISISDGAVIFKSQRDRMENRIDAINMKAVTGPERQINVVGDLKSNSQIITLDVKATIPTGPVDGLTIPVDFKFDAAGLLPQPLSGAGEVKLNGSNLTVNSVTGMLGPSRFSGYASIELTSKPLVKMNLDFQRLEIETANGNTDLSTSRTPTSLSSPPPASKAAEPWSDSEIDLRGLNYIDGEVSLSAAALQIRSVRLTPAKIEASVSNGVLKMALSELGLYDGQAAAGFAVDASIPEPIYALRANLGGVRALPLLSGMADFTSLDGRMQAKADVRTQGKSQRELVANMSGTATFNFQDGQIRGVNIAQMIRSLTTQTLAGWQQDQAVNTDLTELSASMRIDKGQASTDDLRMAGPLVRVTGTGTANLAAKSLALRLEPKLVMTTEGQGSTANPIGLGIPVIVDGPWASPRIYPDMAGVLDNPDAAFGKLREMGQGLFGPGMPGAAGGPNAGGGQIMDSIGAVIQGLGSNQPSAGGKAGQPAPTPQQQPTAPAPANQTIDKMIKDFFGR